VSRRLCEALFMGDKGTLPNGRRVTLLMSPAEAPEREVILRQIYKMSESEFSKYVLQSAFIGRRMGNLRPCL
jgi:hypothetical protein